MSATTDNTLLLLSMEALDAANGQESVQAEAGILVLGISA